jgi:hypothetical protein
MSLAAFQRGAKGDNGCGCFGFIAYGVTAFWIGAAVAVPAGVTYGKLLRYQARR